MYSYDFESSSWSAVAEALQREDVDLTKRACHTAAVLGGKLYTTGESRCAAADAYRRQMLATCTRHAAAWDLHLLAYLLMAGHH